MSRKEKYKKDDLEVIWTKIAVYSLIILVSLITFILAPKKVFVDDQVYSLATSMAVTSDTNFLLYDYEVYSTVERFEEGLIEDVDVVKQAFKERNEIVAVKIYSDENKIEFREDYIFIYSTQVPELNIEYHLVKDLNVADINIPIRTFIMLFNDLSAVVNNIYFVGLLVLTFVIIGPVSFSLTRNIVIVVKYKNNRETCN
jgi:hypothetical protein